MSQVTRILDQIQQGDPHAAEQLLPLVYDELRKLAARKMAQEAPGQTLQATDLVHEAYLRLVTPSKSPPSKGGTPAQSPPSQGGDKGGVHWDSRGHFFAAAAEAMRRILVDQARRRQAAKRGSRAARKQLRESFILAAEPKADVLAVNDALEKLASVDPVAANLVRLRFFAGLDMSEAAQALGMSVRSAQGIWAYARSWLRRQMRSD
jgi:RNA polymerase sigma factor (sigma-70 family)